MEHLSFKKFQSICRFCLKPDIFLKPIFPEPEEAEADEWDDFIETDNLSLVELVENVTGIIMDPEDDFPKFACNSCVSKLKNGGECPEFVKLCLDSMEVLKCIRDNCQTEEDDDSCQSNALGDLSFELQDFDKMMESAKCKSDFDAKQDFLLDENVFKDMKIDNSDD